MLNIKCNARHCYIAQLTAIIDLYGFINKKDDLYSLIIQTDNIIVIKLLLNNLCENFAYIHEEATDYYINIVDSKIATKILNATGFLNLKTNCLYKRYLPIITSKDCCIKSFIKTCFIICGSINHPIKNYHLEFVLSSNSQAENLALLLNYFNLNAKIVLRKENYILYIKEAEQIVDLLNIMGAHSSLFSFENLRVEKEIRNNVNRKVNFEAANINKTIKASVKQIEDIKFIINTKGIDYLDENLKTVALLRIENEDLSLSAISELMEIKISKSGINHRLRKISEIAETLKINGL